MLAPNAEAPNFSAQDHEGNTVTLAALRGSWVLLYFYPRDESVNCTRQACSLRDHWSDLRDSNIHVLGVSSDSSNRHKRFAESRKLPFPLLVDPHRLIIKSYGASGRFGLVRRISYLIDPVGVIRKAWRARRLTKDPQRVLQWVHESSFRQKRPSYPYIPSNPNPLAWTFDFALGPRTIQTTNQRTFSLTFQTAV